MYSKTNAQAAYMTGSGSYWVFTTNSNERLQRNRPDGKTEGNFHSCQSALRREGAAALFAEEPHCARIADHDSHAG